MSARPLLPLLTGLAVAVFCAPAAAASLPQGDQSWLSSLNASAAWSYSKGAGVTVAVLSTGVDAGHPDLAGSVVSGPDFSQSGRVSGGPFWGAEGTACASLIVGQNGIAPSARILSIRVTLEYNDPLNGDPAVTRRLPDAIASGIRYAVAHGATVIDLPLDPGTLGLNGSGEQTGDPSAAGGSPAEQSAVAFALSRGVVLVAPAGDVAGTGENFPAAYRGVIAVGATGAEGAALAPYSNPGSYVTLTAPGTGLTVAAQPSGFTTLSTTGNAAALVAGIAALIRSRFPLLSVAQVTAALERSTGSVTRGTAGTGFGLVNAGLALRTAAAITPARRAAPRRAPTGSGRRAHVRVASLSPGRASTQTVAATALRYAVFAAVFLIVVLALILVVSRARRRPQPRGAAAANGRHAGASGRRARGGAMPSDQASGAPPGDPWRGARRTPGGAGLPGLSAPARGHHPALVPVPKALPARRLALGRGGSRERPPWEPAPPPEPLPSSARSPSPALSPSPAPFPAQAVLASPTPARLPEPDPFHRADPFTGSPGQPAGQTGNFSPLGGPPARAVPDVPSGLSGPPWASSDRFAAAVSHGLPDWGTLNPGATTEAFPAITFPDEDSSGPGHGTWHGPASD